MKRTGLAGIVLLVLIGTVSAQPVAKRLLPDWCGIVGEWETDDKDTISGWGFVRYDHDLPEAFVLKGKMSLEKAGGQGAEGGTRFEICFRRNPTEEWPTYLLRVKFDSVALIKWDEGRKTLDEQKVDVPEKSWIKFELRMKGGKMMAKIGKLRLQAVDPTPIEHQKLLICSVGIKTQLKDLKLTKLK